MSDADAAAAVRARLLALLNHDLRAPLARIAAQACAAAPDLDAIATGARRQLEWLSDLQDCARYELQPPELTPAPAYLQALLRQTVDDEEALRAVPALAVLDARLLGQALRKLQQHADGPVALHAAPVPAPEPSVDAVTLRFHAGAGDGAWSDVAGSLADDIVDPGLLLAAHLVRAMGGLLQRAGAGLRFDITAPLAEEDDAMPPASRFELPEPFGGGHSVLLLEPCDAMHDYLAEILESAGFDVLTTPGGRRPALVLCADENVWTGMRRGHAPPVLLHAAVPPQRPQDFAMVLYKPAPPAMLLDALRGLLQVSAPDARR